MKMKKFISPVLAAALAIGGFGFTANAQSNITGITFDDGSDFTIVQEVYTNQMLDLKGLDANWTKVDLPADAQIQWTTSDENVAYVAGSGLSAEVFLVGEGEAVITASYEGKTVTSNIVVEGTVTQTKAIKNIKVLFDKNKDGVAAADEKVFDGEVPMFQLDTLNMVDSKGNKVLPNDVLKKNQSALHAVLYAIEKEKNPNAQPGELTWVQNQLDNKKLRIESEGSYISILLGAENSWTEGWQYKIGDAEQSKASSIYKLKEGDTVKFEYRAFQW